MTEKPSPLVWARFRFSVIGSLLSAPPPRGELKGAIGALAEKVWTHPVSGRNVQYTATTIEGWYYKAKKAHILMILGLGLVCAGALGNLWDRFLFNGVRDFIKFTSSLLEPFMRGGEWPTFNLADVWICVGIPLILIGDFLHARREEKEEEKGAISP